MSRQADQERIVKRHWAEPGGRHDRLVKAAKIGLPAAGAVMLLALLAAPFDEKGDVSFILDKNEVATAPERMRLEQARYSGVDNKGQPFLIVANRAIQPTSDVPLVQIDGMSGRLDSARGPMLLAAPRGRYDLDAQKMAVLGAIRFSGPDGYRLEANDVGIDLRTRTVRSTGPVNGAMRLGQFSAGGLSADLDERRIALFGGARLKIVQGAFR